MSELSDAIDTNARGPRRVQQDGTSVEQHPIGDQIAADRYARSLDEAATPRRGLRFSKMNAPGSV